MSGIAFVVKVLCCKQGCSGVAEWECWDVGGPQGWAVGFPAVPSVPALAFLWATVTSNQTSKYGLIVKCGDGYQ